MTNSSQLYLYKIRLSEYSTPEICQFPVVRYTDASYWALNCCNSEQVYRRFTAHESSYESWEEAKLALINYHESVLKGDENKLDYYQSKVEQDKAQLELIRGMEKPTT